MQIFFIKKCYKSNKKSYICIWKSDKNLLQWVVLAIFLLFFHILNIKKMSNNLTANQKAQGTNTPTTQVAQTSDATKKSQEIITVDAVEIKQKPSVSQIFEKAEQLRAMRDVYERFTERQKVLIAFEAKASDEGGFLLKGFLKGSEFIEFFHMPSSLEFLREQIRKNQENIKEMEIKIQDFRLD